MCTCVWTVTNIFIHSVAYREILKKDNEPRIEAEDYLKKIERKKKHLQAIKRQT